MNENLLKNSEYRIQDSEWRKLSIRQAVGLEVGDLLEAKVEAGKITFTPKSVVDSGVAESLADFTAGRSFGPFKTDKELIKSLHQESPEVRSKNKANRKLRDEVELFEAVSEARCRGPLTVRNDRGQ
jgi:hypothetical protein